MATIINGSDNFNTNSLGGLKSQQVFTSSGAWTKPAGIKTIKVYVTGAGGGGGGPRDTQTVGYNGASGGAGGTAIRIIDVSNVSSVWVTIGAGGAAGAVASGYGATGGNGTSSSFGAYCTATGGQGGQGGGSGSRPGGLGGTATGGDININGNTGHSATDTANWERTVSGASSFWGGNGNAAYFDGSARTATRNGTFGSGGGGALGYQAVLGSAGGSGVVIIEEYV